MNICFIDWFAYGLFNPKSKIVFGGAQIQLYLLAKELAKNKKFAVSFLTDNQSMNQQDSLSGIKVYQLVRSPKNVGIKGRLLVGNWNFLIKLLIQLKKINANIYVQRAAGAETGLIAIICKILGRRFIYMVAHEQDVNGRFIRQNGWQGQLFLLGLKLADKIICQTLDQQKALDRSLRKKSLVIASGYPIKPLRKITKRGILWVARAETWKQPELFIQLAKKFPREKFTMICPPAENDPEYYKVIFSQAKFISNLKFIKFVPFSEIDVFFAAAKIFVSTSLSEGFPNTFIQAAKNKTPIISYQVNPDKIIDKRQIGFCAHGKKSLAILLKQLLENHRLRRQLAANAYNYAKKYHDIKRTTANIIDNIL